MRFLKFLIVWIASNLAIPFWVVGHVHLSLNVYKDVYEIIASCGMNIVVAIGFFIENPWFYLGIIPLVAGLADFCPVCIFSKKCTPKIKA